jgi:hypothetical protein
MENLRAVPQSLRCNGDKLGDRRLARYVTQQELAGILLTGTDEIRDSTQCTRHWQLILLSTCQ